MSEPRGEVKYLFVKRDAYSRLAIGILSILVIIQILFFVWTLKLLANRQPVKKHVAAVRVIEKPVLRSKVYAPKTVSTSVVKEETPIRVKPVGERKGVSFTFDDPQAHPKIGEELVLAKKNSSNLAETISVHVDEAARLGVKGKGLRIEYQFLDASSFMDWVGLDFRVPSKGSELIFWIRGDAKTGFSQKLKVLISSGGQTRTLPINALGAFWKRVHFPVSGNVDSIRLIILRSNDYDTDGKPCD
ncbi:MAG: hypothetical protein HZC17_06310 [Candidatus Omnitrophica bacterium]|nr:hypothetical protein [Candidatus Omnitrophota bacterium]